MPPARVLPLLAREARHLAGLGALGALTVVFALMAWIGVSVALSGGGAVAITSGSMSPAFSEGDVVVFRPPPVGGVVPGEVITFAPDDGGTPITHRVVAREPVSGRLTTRGDAVAHPDPSPVRADQVRGVGFRLVPLAGYPSLWFSRGRWGALLGLIAGLVGLIVASRWAFVPAHATGRGE